MKPFCQYCFNDPVTHQLMKDDCGTCEMETEVAKRKNICSKCEHSSYCDMSIHYDEKIVMAGCSRFKEKHKKTNGDRIRSMTDEELAKFFTGDLCELFCTIGVSWCNGDCDVHALKWLKQEVPE